MRTFNPPIDIKLILEVIDYNEVINVLKACTEVSGVNDISNAIFSELTFISSKYSLEESLEMIDRTKSSIVLVSDPRIVSNKCSVVVKNPRAEFSRVLRNFSSEYEDQRRWNHVFIDVFIYPKVIIGKNVSIQAGTVIGTAGQGYEKDIDGRLEYFPQLGGVLIEDDVDIGSNTVIMRGTLGNTFIGRGAKIGNLCNIGHNVIIEEDVFISAGVIVCGSAKIGKGSWLAPGAIIRNGLTIPPNTMIGLGAVVVDNKWNGPTIVGNPARDIKK